MLFLQLTINSRTLKCPWTRHKGAPPPKHRLWWIISSVIGVNLNGGFEMISRNVILRPEAKTFKTPGVPECSVDAQWDSEEVQRPFSSFCGFHVKIGGQKNHRNLRAFSEQSHQVVLWIQITSRLKTDWTCSVKTLNNDRVSYLTKFIILLTIYWISSTFIIWGLYFIKDHSGAPIRAEQFTKTTIWPHLWAKRATLNRSYDHFQEKLYKSERDLRRRSNFSSFKNT